MTRERIQKLLKQKEHIRLEFKEAASALPSNLFETICAMLNRDGGDILLGVRDDGYITGVSEPSVAGMVKDLVNLSNNPQKLDPPFILFPQVTQIDGKTIIHIQLPSSSQVHKTANICFDRSDDGDFKVTRPHQVAEIVNRKRNHYTESIVYPALKFEHFKPELFAKVRNLIRSNRADHPWLELSDTQLLEKAGLWRQDLMTGGEGYTLAAALLFGRDETIQSMLPHYKIDALVRVHDAARYDDRLYIQTNLIDAYDLLMDFFAKHCADKFYLQGTQRISLRSRIFREVAANIIIHREYTNAYPCTVIIRKDVVETENANNPHGEGPLNPDTFSPFPKNPSIAKFFIQLGRAEELGSGVLNVSRYIKEYSGKAAAEFIEGTVFKMNIPVPVLADTQPEQPQLGGLNGGLSGGLNSDLEDMLQMIISRPGIKAKELSALLQRPVDTVDKQIAKLADKKIIERRGSKKTGGYYRIETKKESET